MRSSSQATIYVLCLSTLVAFCASASAQYIPPTEPLEIERQANLAMNSLLNPRTPIAALDAFEVQEFSKDPSDLVGLRTAGVREIPEDMKLKVSSFRINTGPVLPGEPLTLNRFKKHDLRVIYYRGQLFPWSFHKAHIADFKAGTMNWAGLINAQPWFEWQPSTGQFELRIGGATQGYLSTFAPRQIIHVYRGTVAPESELMRLLQLMTVKNQCPTSALKKLLPWIREKTLLHAALVKDLGRSDCADIGEDLIRAYAHDIDLTSYGHGALFYSGENEYAGRFAKGSVITFS